MKSRKMLWRLCLGLAVAVTLSITIGISLLNSASFAQWLAATATNRSDGMIRIDNVSGTISRGLDIGQIVVAMDGYRIDLTDIRIDLDLNGIIARSLVLDQLSIRELKVRAIAGSLESSGSDRSISPILILARQINIGTINYESEEQSVALQDTSFGLRVLRNHVEIDQFAAHYEMLRLNGNGSVTMANSTTVNTYICGRGSVAAQDFSGCVQLTGELPELIIDAEFSLPIDVSVAGSVDVGADPELDLAATIGRESVPNFPAAMLQQAELRLVGPLSKFRIEANGVAEYRANTFDVTFAAIRNSEAYTIESLELRSGSSQVVFEGVVPASFESMSGELRGKGLDPARFYPEYSGRLDFRANVDAEFATGISIDFSGISLGGSLRDHPLVGTGVIRYDRGALEIESVQLVSRTDTINIDGRVGDDYDVSVQASIDDLGIVSDLISGGLDTNFRLSGEQTALRIQGDLLAEALVIGETSVERIVLSGDFDPNGVISGTAEALSVQFGGANLDSLNIRTNGVSAAHEIRLSAVSDEWQTEAILTGGISEQNWRGSISQWQITPETLGSWTLESAALLQIGVDRINVNGACLQSNGAQLCAEIDIGGATGDHVQIAANAFDIATLTPFLPVGMRASGTLDLSAEVFAVSTQPRGMLQLQSSSANFQFNVSGDVPVDVPIHKALVDFILEEDLSRLSVELNSNNVAAINAEIETPGRFHDSAPLSGQIKARIADVGVLSMLSPDVGTVGGSIDLNVSLSGTVGAPEIDGSGSWYNGSLAVPIWGVTIDNIHAEALSTALDRAEFSAEGQIDGQLMQLNGSAAIDGNAGWRAQANLSGDTLHLVQRSEADVFVSPDLDISIALPRIEVSGEVIVPKARFAQLALPEQAVVPSVDTIVHRDGEIENAHPLDVRANIDLLLGEDVRYADASMDAQAQGSLKLNYLSEQGVSAQGALRLNGQYDAYGNPLNLERGDLIFVGPLDNPSLDIRAVRRIGEIDAGVQLAGTLKNPSTSIFSNPAMNEADALSYLLFGRPINSSAAGDSQALRSAALSMGLRQALPAIERIGDSLGFDEFAIRNTDTDPGALMAGKYLGPNLYLRYSYGLFNRIGGLLLRYQINDRFSLETQSGEQKSMDLLYTVNKDE